MNTELLIAALARDAGPVRVLPSLGIRWAHWAIVSVVSLGFGVWAFGLRADAAAQAASADFLVRALLTAAIAAAAARHALRWTIPGAEPDGWSRWWPQGAVVAWAGLLFASLGASSSSPLGAVRWHSQCAWQIAVLTSAPALWMFWQSRRGAPYDLGWTSTQAALASAAVAALSVQWICGVNSPAHQIAWHLLPMLAVTLVVAAAGRFALRRY